ncbi:serine/threonine-protein kinase [Rhodopirellula sp. MGV]|uniref:serine/threonine-protein kinase n=1 Tax=Rhodopirellula sp. MGV TaxID=2023130 RepID=UPI000B97AA8A|nr:serine/threonine-protein kinase [Rhodopirellula sp. MGV]OYP36070.1 protein kinase [Rhodopirellula sp. MGV]PNY36572.1 serine/threonine protein kinase [Rhodopirellula baltica]
MSLRQKKLPISALERIDDLCAEFERQWQSNQPPTIESMVADDIDPVERSVLLAELVVLEIDYRRRRGDQPNKHEYLERFPDHSDTLDEAFDDQDKRSRPFAPPTIARLSELFPTLEIIELLGAGGMGAVYKARQQGLDRLVALKVLPEEFAHDVKFALRFTREARTLAKLNHPNIVSVYEFGKAEDTFYFLMEFVDGSTLRDVVSGGQLKPEHALAIVPHLCDALQFAHDKGVIHRDIKPENILMSQDGTVKIADFGLSRILDSDNQATGLTATHQVMGTPRYMAPEQFESTRSVDHRADIYSLGVVFYEMLTGELPIGRFAAPSRKVAIDVRLDEVVLRTLEKEPQRRYQRASQIKSDIQTIGSVTRNDSALAPTMDITNGHATADIDSDSSSANTTASAANLQQQELTARLFLTRRELMDQIKTSLSPLFQGQLFQIFVGILLIGLGAQCWARASEFHRVVCGGIIHVYGILVIAAGIAVCTRIKRIDFTESVDQIRGKLDTVRRVYVKVAPIVGFPWWLMWIPAAVAFGFDAVLVPSSLIPSIVVGVIGTAVSFWLYFRAMRPGRPNAQAWEKQFAGKSLAEASAILREVEQAQIQ